MEKELYNEKQVQAILKGGEESAKHTIFKNFICDEIKEIGDPDDRILEFTISTGSVDRHGDTVNPDGWALENFKKNPVVLWAHRSGELPIAKAVSVFMEEGKLKARAKFATADLNPLADSVFRMLKDKFLNATSVGFQSQEALANEDREDDFWMPVDFVRQELLEFSVVPVPANPEALQDAKNAGIDVGPVLKWAENIIRDCKGDNPNNFKIELDDESKLLLERIEKAVTGFKALSSKPITTPKPKSAKPSTPPASDMSIEELTKNISESVHQIFLDEIKTPLTGQVE